MSKLYRVEKDGVTFYVQPEQVGMYQRDGWDVYRQVEERVTSDVTVSVDSDVSEGIVIEEVTTRG
jgi:hypothetical protein